MDSYELPVGIRTVQVRGNKVFTNNKPFYFTGFGKHEGTATRELVARDRNHPFVVMWAVVNEPAASEQGTQEYLEPLAVLTRRLDPTRPVCYANEYQASVDKCLLSDLFDVLCLNRCYGWYLHTGDLEAAEEGLEKGLSGREEKFRKPIIMPEYGADTLAGLHTIGDVPWSEEHQSRVLEMSHGAFDRVESVVGEHVWNCADFQTPSSFIFRVASNKKGVFTRDRRPKMAAHVLRKRWTEQRPKELAPGTSLSNVQAAVCDTHE
ncbi:glycosyl hydrolase family 2 [Colletotrichum tofieldiae]|nr:glycosyl hydrolase family 2 [Colletotrichum tofieldiae]GKT77088.1 glycosyl hydrolase family 2 [Colletotrichum tofieldiae]